MARRISGSKSPRSAKASGAKASNEAGLPSREAVLQFIRENPDRTAKRDIAKAFGLKGGDRIWLKDMLRALQEEGLLKKSRKRLMRPGQLPHVVVLDIFSRDAGGALIARPAEKDDQDEGEGPLPLVEIRSQKSGRAAGIGDRVLARVFPNEGDAGPAYTGRVMKVFEKRRQSVLGVFRKAKDGTFRIEPIERTQRELTIGAEARGDAQDGDLVEVEPVSAGRYGPARGKVVSVIGSLASEKAVSMIAIHAHEIPHIFPAAVLEEAEAATPVDLSGREDWRDWPLITIDPADAKDHDDAVMAEPDPDEKNPGGFIATVAIADVAHYVRAGSALDREALKRGNSVYFPDRVVPMLPERISNDLCSLREGEARPALAVRMRFTADGRKLGHSFHRVMMRSVAKLSYQQAQAAINGNPDDKTGPLLEPVLQPLWDAYAALRRGREARQPLELDLPERKILLKEDGTVDRVVVPPRLDAHKLIEEFMVQANVAAAETLETKRQPLVYRVHDAPSLAKQEALREFLRSFEISLARGAQLKPSQFNAILARVRDTEHEQLVNEVVLRSQSQAVYAPENLGHFGLNLRRYAHFTSPIRRYADLIVHRALIAALGFGKDGLRPDEEARLEEISALISATERRAMAAERDTIDRLVAEHLSGRVDEDFEARISGVAKAGLFVQLPDYGADGFIPISTVGDEYYIYDEARHALVGERSGKGFQLGDSVSVRLVEVAPLAGAMHFEMLSEPDRLPGSMKSFHKVKGARGRGRSNGQRPAGRRRR
ncbi:ribonuclease R [Nitratireductor sp. ZSWI3]|uniref:ribonuclease R n=1 Tax=Nitratireductor sp. ZSWI3 TaxID=2966359 RepID=UPI00214FA2F6|nr:ribonuclease R [Nitratireductor sp. ZSWI3]MCR4265432.1 ribonuclease R [Nitratireductor sp. ZSWI3]